MYCYDNSVSSGDMQITTLLVLRLPLVYTPGIRTLSCSLFTGECDAFPLSYVNHKSGQTFLKTKKSDKNLLQSSEVSYMEIPNIF